MVKKKVKKWRIKSGTTKIEVPVNKNNITMKIGLEQAEPIAKDAVAITATGIKGLPKSGHVTLPRGSIPSPSGGKSDAFDFAQALMAHDPVAERALYQALRKPEDEPSLADRFLASCHVEAKRLGLTGRMLKEADASFGLYRDAMRRAHRFVLDDDFTRLATNVAQNTPPEKLLARLLYANLPYETCWIEFNLHVKVQTMRAFHKRNDVDMSDIAEHMGLLMQRWDTNSAVVTMVNGETGKPRDDGHVPLVHFINYFYSTDERVWSPKLYFGCVPLVAGMIMPEQMKDWTQETYDIWTTRVSATLWGYTEQADAGGFIGGVYDLNRLRMPSFLQRHGVPGFSLGRRIYDNIMKSGSQVIGLPNFEKAIDAVNKLASRELIEFTGMMRWIVTVIAMLNEVPVHSELVQRTNQMRVGLTGKRRFLDYHRITLRLPKTKPINWVERHFSNVERARHRAHEVRGHWRTYLHDVHCKREEHDWEYDHEHGYRLCGKCMAFGRFIHEHIRGNPELGWVRKDYVIKRDKQG
jgi:hypothetical protein